MTLTTHMILVSAQPIPNLTPLLDDSLGVKKVIMLVSTDMQKRSIALEAILKPRGIKVERHTVEDPWDAAMISDQVLDILTDYPNRNIALNATGGTKLMSIAAYEAFRSDDFPVFYVHPEKDRLIWVTPRQAPVELANRLKIKDYLMAYGAESVTVPSVLGVPEPVRLLTQNLLTDIDRYAIELTTLNFLAYEAKDKPRLTVTIKESPAARARLWDLIELFECAGLCSINGQQLSFADEEARFIANGGWLELHTYALCLNLKKSLDIQDVAANITIHRKPGGKDEVKNEIDVALIKENRLHLMECKTKRYQQDKDADALYKLDSLRDLVGGLQGRAMLISFNELDKTARARAKELKIAVHCKSELRNLQQHLTHWLKSDR
ncbi:DUF1887 family CARF protein [Methylicorpusculum oleiharenae]|uniref:Card1-like endonuclease domain-containing protein n=1 Tax=Methylicorpusculum oleiharenae TaxID=1338687 RepID=UPI0013599A70|nr:DUF1887 family CARF protein [Methylicorpusculum oleiharenae]MCD2452425.1 DUF1887 family CARF protein [Methylicorpusculum oleiharenae]